MAARAALRVAARALAATLGSYAVAAGTAALTAVLLVVVAGLSRSDALIVGSIAAYLLFALAMLWSFAERRLIRVWTVMSVAAAATHGIAWGLAPWMPLSRIAA